MTTEEFLRNNKIMNTSMGCAACGFPNVLNNPKQQCYEISGIPVCAQCIGDMAEPMGVARKALQEQREDAALSLPTASGGMIRASRYDSHIAVEYERGDAKSLFSLSKESAIALADYIRETAADMKDCPICREEDKEFASSQADSDKPSG